MGLKQIKRTNVSFFLSVLNLFRISVSPLFKCFTTGPSSTKTYPITFIWFYFFLKQTTFSFKLNCFVYFSWYAHYFELCSFKINFEMLVSVVTFPLLILWVTWTLVLKCVKQKIFMWVGRWNILSVLLFVVYTLNSINRLEKGHS
jgi:hypothetical protein